MREGVAVEMQGKSERTQRIRALRFRSCSNPLRELLNHFGCDVENAPRIRTRKPVQELLDRDQTTGLHARWFVGMPPPPEPIGRYGICRKRRVEDLGGVDLLAF